MSTATINRPVTGPRVHLCEECRELLASLLDQTQERGDQLWACGECGQIRKWGNTRPWDSSLRPALKCKDCHAVTRHAFVGLAGMRN